LARSSPRKPNQTDVHPWLFVRYAAFRGLGEAGEHDVQETFLEASKSATRGKLSSELAPYLERVKFAPDGTVNVSDLAALAAWSLLGSVRRQPLELRRCPQCRGQWLARPDESKYCQRIAPGQIRMDCRTLAKEKRLAGDPAYRRYRREYKRLAEAQSRGAIDAKDLMRWREQNGPADWLPFDEWKT
jgi:Zn-finger nucleic acid-binding protein